MAITHLQKLKNSYLQLAGFYREAHQALGQVPGNNARDLVTGLCGDAEGLCLAIVRNCDSILEAVCQLPDGKIVECVMAKNLLRGACENLHKRYAAYTQDSVLQLEAEVASGSSSQGSSQMYDMVKGGSVNVQLRVALLGSFMCFLGIEQALKWCCLLEGSFVDESSVVRCLSDLI